MGGENALKEAKVVIFMFKDIVVKLCSNDGCRMFFRQPQALWGESVVMKYWARSVWGVMGGQADVAMCGRMWWYCFRMMECGLAVVE